MRRLLVPVALVAAILAVVALESPWFGHTHRRSARAPRSEETPPGTPAGAEAAPRPAAAAPNGEEPAEALARVHGVVTGATGALWGARVVAYAPDSEDVVAETYTNPEGAYSLAVGTSMDFDLAVEPIAETYLVAMRRRGLVLEAGDDREENFALGPIATIRGRIVDRSGAGLGGIELLAVRPEDLGMDPSVHPDHVLGRDVGRCRTDAGGSFRLGCAVQGTLAIVVRNPDWTLAAPAAAATGCSAATFVAVPAISVDLRVADIETEELVKAFSAKVSIADWGNGAAAPERRVVFEGFGSDGIFSRREPGEQGPRFPLFPELEVTARGFVPWRGGVSRRGAQAVWLLPAREKNATIRVTFDDGEPYHGRIQANFRARSGRSAGSVPFDPAGNGAFRGAMPRGRWAVEVRPMTVFGYPQLAGDIDVTADADAELKFVLPAGGTVILRPPPGATGRHVAQIRKNDEVRDGTLFGVPPLGTRIEGIPPGLYQVGWAPTDGSIDTAPWPTAGSIGESLREVHVVAGGTEEIVLPAR